mgnify:CR=1 FL=1
MLDVTKVPSPCYVMEEDLLRKNLSLIKSVAERAGVEIILAFKAFAMWKSFPIFREYIHYTTASLNTKPDWLSKSLAARLIRILLLIQRPIFLLF